ncbi:MAG: transposase [Candidatus Zixiibacteriota bacterium]
MNAQEKRIDAVKRFLQGEKISIISRSLGHSRRWFYYWLERYDPSDPSWSQDHSRKPKEVANKTPEELERMICEIRKRLVRTKYAQKGALIIQWELQRLGVYPVPQVWTINRILKRHGLVVKPSHVPRGTPYPVLVANQPNDVHQLDLVGPRYLDGGQRFYGVHLIDTFSNAAALEVVSSKRAVDVVEALVTAWQRLGIPRRLQVDNELTFRGSNRYPRSFGLLIRLCLYLGVEPVFIPEAEPWRNGVIERLNDVYDKLFLRSQHFQDLLHLREELPVFETFHNTQHRYAKLSQNVPWKVHTSTPIKTLSQTFSLHRDGLPWRDGRISFVRLTDKQGRVRFFTESFLVDETLVHEYVTGTIYTEPEVIKFTHQDRVIKTFRYSTKKKDL